MSLDFLPPDKSDQPITPANAREFELFNDRHYYNNSPADGGSESSRDDAFHLFCRLPLELRLKIWTINLKRHRFLHILVSHKPDSLGHSGRDEATEEHTEQAAQDGSSDEEFSNFAHQSQLEFDKTYEVCLRAEPLLSVLFYTCRESARAAREFYRIPLRLSPTLPGRVATQPGRKKVVFLNPEWDILDFTYHGLDPEGPNEVQTVVEALHLLKTADVRGKGDLNLSLDGLQILRLANLEKARVSAPVWHSYRDTIANLHRLYWRATPPDNARFSVGHLNCHQTVPWYNTSMPLMADTTAVDFIGPDPRPISPDLHQVWFGTDSRQIPKFWSELESSLGVRAGQDAGMPVDCRVLLASCPWDGHGMTDGIVTFLISNRKTADIYLTKETRDACDFLGSKLALGGWRRSVERFTPEMNPRSLQEWVDGRVPNTAVGFWLIDPAQLGPPSEPDAMDFPDNEPAVLNLAGRDSKMESCLFGLRGLRN